MKLAQSRLTAQGQISVPAEVRKRLELAPGSVIEWDAEDDRVVVRRVGRHTSEAIHAALFPRSPRPRTQDELREGLRRHAEARHARR
jgi:AbrB family looped-hinge helix DNA binding protein